MKPSSAYRYLVFLLSFLFVVLIVAFSNTPYLTAFLGKPLKPTLPMPIPTLNFPRVMNVLVFMDDTSYTVNDTEIQETFNYANNILLKRTNTKFKILDVVHVNVSADGEEMAVLNEFIANNKSLILKTHYIVFFSEHPNCSHTYGGCVGPALQLKKGFGIENYCNPFTSGSGENTFPYLTFIDWNGRYAGCGYDDGGYGNNHISDVSTGGHCKNQPGTECIFSDTLQYYVCANALNDYYAQDPLIYRTSTIIHELFHYFGTNIDGAGDHAVDSQACVEKFQSQNYQFKFQCPSNADMSSCFFNICQYAWVNFIKAPNTCSLKLPIYP